MCSDETKELIMTFIDYAKTAKPSEFRFILNWKDYRLCSHKCRSYKILVQCLHKISNRLFKKYLKGVSIGEGNLNQLLAYQQLQLILKFYQGEFDTYTNMTHEYEAYLMETGDFIYAALLGCERPFEDLRDFRE